MSQIRHATAVVCALALCSGFTVRAQCRPHQRRVTVADTIRMTELSPPEPEAGAHPSAIASFSPDGRHFAVIVKRGNLRNDTNLFTLRIYSTQKAFRTQKAQLTLRLASGSNRPAIADLRWLKSGHTLLFLGEEPNRNAQIYSFDLRSGQLRQLTAHSTSVVRFDTSDDGRVIVFEAEPPPEDIVDTPETRRHGFVVQGQELSTILFSGYRSAQSMAFHPRQLFIMKAGGKPRLVASENGIWPFLTLSVSPDGRYALLGALMRHVPGDWRDYREHVLHEVVAERRQPGTVSEVQSYLLLDTKTSRLTPLLGAPKDWPDDGYLWLDSGRTLVVSHAYLPLDGVSAADRAVRERQAFVVAVSLPSRSFSAIGSDDLSASGWDAANREITLTGEGREAGVREVYQRRGGAWKEISKEKRSSKDSRPTLRLVEGMNTPPTLWLSDPLSGRSVRLLDLNPQFADLCFAREEEIAWKASDGHPVRGGLYLPPGGAPAGHYPLVIQTHGFDPHAFWIDGPWHSAFAAQPLAARGIAVLQMDYDHVGGHTPAEAPRAMAAIDGAIDALSAQGIIDPDRVGIIGFSRTVYHVAYTLTHSRHHFSAATLADGFDADYFQTVVFPGTEGSDAAAVNGGPPYGPDLRKWIGRSPLFSIASVTSPVRLESYNMDSVLGMWGWYSLLTQRGMPVDMISLPHAPHLLVRPWERMASQQGNVDWFCFWLRGEKDPAKDKAAEYARWEYLRQLLRKAMAGNPAPRKAGG